MFLDVISFLTILLGERGRQRERYVEGTSTT
jgi:hypothetical protein